MIADVCTLGSSLFSCLSWCDCAVFATVHNFLLCAQRDGLNPTLRVDQLAQVRFALFGLVVFCFSFSCLRCCVVSWFAFLLLACLCRRRWREIRRRTMLSLCTIATWPVALRSCSTTLDFVHFISHDFTPLLQNLVVTLQLTDGVFWCGDNNVANQVARSCLFWLCCRSYCLGSGVASTERSAHSAGVSPSQQAHVADLSENSLPLPRCFLLLTLWQDAHVVATREHEPEPARRNLQGPGTHCGRLMRQIKKDFFFCQHFLRPQRAGLHEWDDGNDSVQLKEHRIRRAQSPNGEQAQGGRNASANAA
jgi:hypothetical protein